MLYRHFSPWFRNAKVTLPWERGKQDSGPDLIFKLCAIKRLVKPTYELADHKRLGVGQKNERLPHLNLRRGKRDWKYPHSSRHFARVGQPEVSLPESHCWAARSRRHRGEGGDRVSPHISTAGGGGWGRDRRPRSSEPRGRGGAWGGAEDVRSEARGGRRGLKAGQRTVKLRGSQGCAAWRLEAGGGA